MIAGKKIDSLGLDFSNSFVKTVGNGATTSFWDDTWLSEGNLKTKLKRLYKLKALKDVVVRDRFIQGDSCCSGSWNWIRQPSGRALGELNALSNLIQSFAYKNSEIDGSWSWNMVSSGKFTTKALKEKIEEKLNEGHSLHIETQQNNLVPKKIEIFIWRARLRRLAIRVELNKRGLDLDSILCPLCKNDIESVEHSLILCNHVLKVWEKVYKWWGFTHVSNLSISEVFLGRSTQVLTALQTKVWQAVEWSCGYLIWKNRN
ncbi:uncharacterized protein [Rutidosis leptorrhynchoides]|uniref:uncharacterized protein n=1 Tax=Rutidosis leptorrhynchoides TaxID=125765 RepID=UPI003A9A3969